MQRFPTCRLLQMLACACVIASTAGLRVGRAASLPPSQRTTISLGQTQWKYLFGDPAGAQATAFPDAGWQTVGIPYSADQLDGFINAESGGGDGDLNGPISWYRNHFTLSPGQAGSKVLVEFEGAHTGVQVFINGTLLPGVSAVAVDAQATHVVGFVPFIVDLTAHVKFDGTDQVLAVRAAKNAAFFEPPGFSQGFRFGQSDSGLFRPVDMFITSPVHIPENVYSNLGTWGTYVATVSASSSAALINVQTNVLNESNTPQAATLTTQIVDASGNVVASAQASQTLPPNAAPGLHPTLFNQQMTVTNPNLWYPNNSIYGKPYMYKVFHIVSIGGAVVDAVQSPLGIRTITWDANFPYINGKMHYLWGASGRYDYPALGSAVPEEQKWRDLQLLAQAGGNLWRPGHSTESEAFVNAADAYGIMIVQPSGEGEGSFSAHCNTPPCDMQTLKSELHRDMIIRDRNHPSILAWEADNGPIDTAFAQSLKALSVKWDPINTRVQADRTPNPANGDILGCTLEGCEVLTKQEFKNNPAWGSEYWGTGTARQAWDYELAFAAPFLDNWRQSRAAGAFGIAQWYFADSPGEVSNFVEGVTEPNVRSLGASMTDMNRFPKLLYYIYESAWTPFSLQPVVHLAHHWNRAGAIQVNAFSNCPKVRLLINGVSQGDQVPNPWTSNAQSNLGQSTTLMPFQVHWNVTWQAGTVAAECIDAYGNVAATDTRTTAGTPDHIALDLVPEVVRPDGSSFAISANGSDAAFVVAKIVDANGVVVPTASNTITFSVSGPATYVGGSQQYVTANGTDAYTAAQGAAGNPIAAMLYQSPGDPQLSAEGGMTKVALRSQFQTGQVVVTATSPGLGNGTASYIVGPIANTQPVAGPPSVIVPPAGQAVTAGQSAQFAVTATGAAPLSFQWLLNGAVIPGATAATYQTPATTIGQNGSAYAVTITNGPGVSVTSPAATLTVAAPAAPVVLSGPVSVTATVGATAQFSVTATGSPTLMYQWYANGTAIAGATATSYTTPVLAASDNATQFTVAVGNPVQTVTSAPALLSVGAAIAPVITANPHGAAVPLNQPASFSVIASGSAPLAYQWFKAGAPITGATASGFTVAAVQASDAASYTVSVSNIVGTATSAPAVLTIAPPGANIALFGRATASSAQDPVNLPASAAFDGNLTTRWASLPGIDPSWIETDLGTAQNFNTVVLYWENAYASIYQIQYSNDNATWYRAALNSAGKGGIETLSFPTVHARYVRMLGQARVTAYGYSLYEFQIYDAEQCGAARERFTVVNPSTARDNLTHLTWSRAEYTLTTPGAQLTQSLAESYCAGLGMRLPTLAEAVGITGTSDAQCAFPLSWSTWTTTPYPGNAAYAYIVSAAGQTSFAVANNFPGGALCTSGTSARFGPPGITAQPAAQSVTVGSAATFIVGATGAAPIAYQWFANGVAIVGATNAAYVTPPTALADNATKFSVRLTGPTGLVRMSASAELTVQALAPTITTQPSPQTVALGQSAKFSVAAAGTGPLSYQWFGRGRAIAGATAASLATPPAAAGDNGALFAVTVTGPTGLATQSNTVGLAVSGTGSAGTDLVAIAAGSGTAVGSFGADAGFAGGGTHAQPGATISVAGVPDAAPASVYTAERDGVFSYTVGGLKAGANYTLRLHFADFAFATPGQRVFDVTVNNTLALLNFDIVAAAGGQNQAVVESFTAQANSANQVTVGFLTGLANQPKLSGLEIVQPGTGSAPVITLQPAPQSVALGQPASFSVSVAGTGPFTYRWFRNNVAVPGANAASYTTPATQAGDAGALFQAVVTSASGETVNSTLAPLGVSGPGLDLVAINAGATVPTGVFSADTGFQGGAAHYNQGTAITTAGIANAAPEQVYRSSRQGDTIYQIGGLTPLASYPMRLHFAELYWPNVGGRVFDVAINGTVVLPALDIVKEAGGENVALVEPETASADRYGNITITLTTGAADQPSVSAIEVLAPGGAPASAPSAEASGPAAPLASADALHPSVQAASRTGTAGADTTGGPVIVTPPASVTAIIGHTALFTLQATGTGKLTYAWSKNGVPIGGAVRPSYTTPGTIGTDNGAVFSVLVTDSTGATATASATLTVDANPAYTVVPGVIVTDLNNNTRGAYPDSQVYITVLGNNPTTGALSWVKPDGTVAAASPADNTAPGHLTAGGQDYPNYAFTLAQTHTLMLPPISSGRIFVSLGSPLFTKVLEDSNGHVGYAGPNPLNGTDPNIGVHYDWYEFNYQNGGIFINTTQVDEFGLPLLLDVWGSNATFHMQTGINTPVAILDRAFAQQTPAAFHTSPVSNLRILAPGHASMMAGGTDAHYFDAYVASVWSYYRTHKLTVSLFGGAREFTGITTSTQFTFSEVNLNNGAYKGGTYTVAGPPSTQDIVFCDNTLATGSPVPDLNTVELALEAQFCAAYNRHVMGSYPAWDVPSAYYAARPANYYAQFWHRYSVGGLAYGFAYDDVNAQSSTIQSGAPEHMAFGIGW